MSVVRGRKSPKAAESLQAMDDYLSSLGLVRKPIAKDGSCLFRAVAEQVFHCQARHLEVREACVRYMDRNRDIFEAFVPGPFDHHLWTLQNPKEWAGQVEISALSLMYKCDFIIYQDVGRPPARVTENGFADKVVLCFSHGNHYDSVYPKQFQIDAAMCQSLVYELLYKDVFKMDHDIAVVKDMLGNKQQKIRKDSTSESESSPSKNCGSDKPDSELEGSTELDVSTESDKSRDNTERPNEKATQANGAVEYSKKDGRRFPLPFKVAKALDPECYRNVEYDTWMDSKKEQQRQDMHLATMMQYAPGDKCQVRLEGNVKYYMAHVQEVQAESGPVTVFIEELGEKHTVPVKNLKPITQVPPVPTVPMPWTAVPAKGYKNLSGYYQKGAIVPQEIAACFSPPWHPFAEDPRNKRKNRRKGRENGIPPFMVQRVQPSLPPRLQHEGQYSPKYHHHHGREYQGRDYQGRDYQGRDYQSREYQGREYQGRDRDYQPRDRDREFQRPPHGQRYNGQASPRYQHYGRDYHSRDYQGRMYHGSPHGHRNQPPRFMRQDQMDGRGPGPRPGSRYQYSHGRGRGRGRNTPTPPPGPPQGEMDEKQAIEESIVLYELQQRDPDAFPALPTSNGQVQHVQSNTVWGRGRGRGMGRRTPTPPPPSTTPSDGGHSMTMEEGSLCSSMQELNMNERASPDGERICSPVSHQMEVPPMKRVMTPTKEFVPRSSRTPSPYQNPTPPLQSQSANAEISSSNSGSNQQMSTDSTSSPASTPNTPPPQTVAPNGYVPYMQPMHVPFYPIMIQATDNLTGPVNLNFGPSRDPYGNDLPHSDVSTLRFFYNLGIEYYRCCMSMMAIQHQQQEAAMANAYFYNQAQGQVQPQYQPASSSDGQNSSGQPAQEGEDPQQEGSDQLPPNGQSQDKPLPQGAHVYTSASSFNPGNPPGDYHTGAGSDYPPGKTNKSCSDDNSNDSVGNNKDVSVSRSNSMTSVQSSGDSASMNVQYGSDSVCGSSVSYVQPSPNALQQTSSSTTVGSEDSSPDYTDSGVASEGSGSQSSIPRPTSLGPGLPKRHYMEHRGSPKLIPGRWSTPERSGSSDSLNQEAFHMGRPPYGPKRGPRDRQPGFYRPSYFPNRPYMSQQPPRRQYEGQPLYHPQLYSNPVRYSNPTHHMSQPQQYYMNQYTGPSRMALHGNMGSQAAGMYNRAAGMYTHPSQQLNVPPGVTSVPYPPMSPSLHVPAAALHAPNIASSPSATGQYYPAQAPGPVDPNPPGSQGPTPIPVPSSAANATYYTAHPGGDMPSHQHYASTYDNQASYQYPATMGGSWQPAHGVPLYGSPNKVTVAYATNSPPVGYQGYTGAPQM
ncbi:putative bifunctional UDP-N-acetylglucosamine transferase and deubiquitinase ALG13 isoform X3 [Branchiostoma floridae]|uniref:Bifunctional UDP-N-acetylglucosamine transferase and deubiquitinase ALG13 isoform X3 n=1 Tax=Branchiostoma floridae TaxID=7739 RepID=A0A9J7LG94_BRAFL|nr:putative bifunctional UDP-N-acetylglucosamine transferase and deubiquitinase ALG13 isoform X3 [Branchiostoma floridae]